MTLRHGLSQSAVDRITGVLTRFPDVNRAILFGSRAKATYKPGSDIDLALVGDGLDWRIVGKIYDALDDLLLPYRFSLVVYDKNADPEVAAHIQRVGISLFQRERVDVSPAPENHRESHPQYPPPKSTSW
jgi:predicted nucleotidyltransferase